MRDVEHFFWDFDGTLFDTYPVIIENLQLALSILATTAIPMKQ